MNDPRCLIADDHPALTSAVSSYLSENGFQIVGPASDRRRALALIAEAERELDVLGLLAEGLQHEEIGRRLGISSETVRTHLRKASDRLGASTRTQAVATALRLGLIA